MRQFRIFAVILGVVLGADSAFAVKFANQFVEFDLPAAWTCFLEGTEWVCQNPQDAVKKKEAIIVLAAKIQGDQDTLDQYLNYLKAPKTFTSSQGKSLTSTVSYAQNKSINDRMWVDSLHMESEVPGFYTRYIATVTDGIGILVTYSVNKAKYQEYTPMFEEMVKSLKAFRKDGGLNAAPANSDLFKNAKIPAGVTGDTVFGSVQGAGEEAQKPKASGLDALMNDPIMFYGGLGALALIVLSILKKRKK
jgi:hypothetical protein